MKINRKQFISKATNYRTREAMSGGVVVFFKEGNKWIITGWMNELRDPQKWVPGCIAVDHQNNFFQATGGDEYNGAKEWVALS